MKITEDTVALIANAKRGDLRAFDELIDVYAPKIYGFVYRLTNRTHDAEDLVQEVFLRVVRMIGEYQHDGRFEAWLFRIAMNLVRDRVRLIRRSPHFSQLDGGAAGDGNSTTMWDQPADPSVCPPDHGMALLEDSDRLGRAMANLPLAERQVILLRHYTDMGFAEIAELMETPLGTALARSHRALAKLREWMEAAD